MSCRAAGGEVDGGIGQIGPSSPIQRSDLGRLRARGCTGRFNKLRSVWVGHRNGWSRRVEGRREVVAEDLRPRGDLAVGTNGTNE